MLRILKSGFYSSIQDKGRIGFASFGVPVSGSMDAFSADLANSILNNSLDDAVVEITFGFCEFQFLEDTFIAISGGDFSPKINQESIKMNQKIKVVKNDILSFGKINYGVRAYLAISGGFLSQKILGSRSFFKTVTKSSFLEKGMEIPYTANLQDSISSNSSIKHNQFHFKSLELMCFIGPEFNMLNKQQQEMLFHQEFTISNDNSRMGYKLEEIIVNNLPSILTSSVLPGTVQLTPSGKLIVLMKDCQVTGGYPRILQLHENSIHKLAQKTVRQKIKFIK